MTHIPWNTGLSHVHYTFRSIIGSSRVLSVKQLCFKSDYITKNRLILVTDHFNCSILLISMCRQAVLYYSKYHGSWVQKMFENIIIRVVQDIIFSSFVIGPLYICIYQHIIGCKSVFIMLLAFSDVWLNSKVMVPAVNYIVRSKENHMFNCKHVRYILITI